jgi:hypothetical protein
VADEVSLHSDTVDWLEKRNAQRAALQGAFGAGEAEEEAAEAEAPAAAAGCVVEKGGCPDLNGQFTAYPPDDDIEQETAEKGWPECDGLYGDTNSNLKKKDELVMPEVIVQERQINTLESYRRMLLHKKQRKCHLLAAYAEYWEAEGRSQSELEELMLNKRVGVQGNAGGGGNGAENG